MNNLKEEFPYYITATYNTEYAEFIEHSRPITFYITSEEDERKAKFAVLQNIKPEHLNDVVALKTGGGYSSQETTEALRHLLSEENADLMINDGAYSIDYWMPETDAVITLDKSYKHNN